ncbi:MAG: histidine triad nucleotide-binding protein [Gemmatimonadaceae bacterium]
MNKNCIFCRIGRGDISTAFVAESERAVAFRDIDPKAPLHVLVIPRAHIDSLASAEDESLLGEMLGMAARIARDEGYSASGYRVVVNTGSDGGQSVPHLHLHVLAGRHLGWPPG